MGSAWFYMVLLNSRMVVQNPLRLSSASKRWTCVSSVHVLQWISTSISSPTWNTQRWHVLTCQTPNDKPHRYISLLMCLWLIIGSTVANNKTVEFTFGLLLEAQRSSPKMLSSQLTEYVAKSHLRFIACQMGQLDERIFRKGIYQPWTNNHFTNHRLLNYWTPKEHLYHETNGMWKEGSWSSSHYW